MIGGTERVAGWLASRPLQEPQSQVDGRQAAHIPPVAFGLQLLEKGCCIPGVDRLQQPLVGTAHLRLRNAIQSVGVAKGWAHVCQVRCRDHQCPPGCQHLA